MPDCRPCLLLSAFLCGAMPGRVAAQEAPPPAPAPALWEAGVGAVAVAAPDYPAAATSRVRAAVVPIVIYRGERLRVDDEGVRGRLADAGRFEFDLSGAANFNSRRSAAREGMPALDYTFELGPQLVYRQPPSPEGPRFSAHLKARGVFSTDWRSIRSRGHVVEPELRWRGRGWPLKASQWQLGVQATWASEALQDYFYEVAPAYSTPQRPAYDASSGYLGSELRGAIAHRLSPHATLSVGLAFDIHRDAANRDSPLFGRVQTVRATVALVWTPWRSAQVQAGVD